MKALNHLVLAGLLLLAACCPRAAERATRVVDELSAFLTKANEPLVAQLLHRC
jgi:hypothetical protein